MMNTIKSWLGAHRRLNILALLFLASALVYNFPVLLSWLPPDLQKSVELVADSIVRYSVLLVLMWAKDRTIAGNGTADAPIIKA